jgi:NADH:ubiquinone oxidoreductase subunit 6 (subunit J)
MDPGGLTGMDMTHQKRTAGALAILSAAGLALVAVLVSWPAGSGPTVSVRDIGFEVMGRGFFVFLLAAFTIMLAMVGGIMLASHSGRYGVEAPSGERLASDTAEDGERGREA